MIGLIGISLITDNKRQIHCGPDIQNQHCSLILCTNFESGDFSTRPMQRGEGYQVILTEYLCLIFTLFFNGFVFVYPFVIVLFCFIGILSWSNWRHIRIIVAKNASDIKSVCQPSNHYAIYPVIKIYFCWICYLSKSMESVVNIYCENDNDLLTQYVHFHQKWINIFETA